MTMNYSKNCAFLFLLHLKSPNVTRIDSSYLRKFHQYSLLWDETNFLVSMKFMI